MSNLVLDILEVALNMEQIVLILYYIVTPAYLYDAMSLVSGHYSDENKCLKL